MPETSRPSPGFKAGADATLPWTAPRSPEFFTLYETESYEVLVGPGYQPPQRAHTADQKRRPRASATPLGRSRAWHASQGIGVGGRLGDHQIWVRLRHTAGVWREQ